MRFLRFAAVTSLLVVLWLGTPSLAAESGFLSKDAIDLLTLLAPPPGPQDSRTQTELEELRRVQATRTLERVAMAQADVEETVFRLTVVLDKTLTPDKLPKTVAFFKKLTVDEEIATDSAKNGFGRPRPYEVAGDLQPVCPLPKSRAYPSGHSTTGYYMGVVLAAMVPEYRAAIFTRTEEFAESRVVCGVHYRSDIDAGRIAGTALAAVAMNDPQFRAEFAAARAELRAALGL
jgi:acid phosphatase (class A)